MNTTNNIPLDGSTSSPTRETLAFDNFMEQTSFPLKYPLSQKRGVVTRLNLEKQNPHQWLQKTIQKEKCNYSEVN